MSETPMVTFSSVDNPNTWNIEGESKCLVFASPSEARRAEELFAAMQRELAAERERADRNQEDALTLMRALIKVRQQMFPQHNQRAVVSRDFPKLAAIDSARRK